MANSCGTDHTDLEEIEGGIYRDPATETMHICMDEFLPANGIPDTPANRAMIEEACREKAHELGIPVSTPYRGEDH